MPAKEIKELRQTGRLEEAHAMAKAELEAEPDNLWAKRNLSWVLYSQLDKAANNLDQFLAKLEELETLELPESEEMLYDNLSIVIAKAVRQITGQQNVNMSSLDALFSKVSTLPLVKPSKWYSSLFQAFHKGYKDTDRYIAFADWWGLENFREEDYQKEKMPDGKEMMAIAEQAYIAYSKQLLPKHTMFGEVIFDKEKVEVFMPKLDQVVESYPNYVYPAYYKAKLLLALGDEENLLSAILPFAKKKRNDFWVWDVLSEAFKDDEEKVLACYCRALTCNSPEEMLVSLRQKMATIFINKELHNEARTEIEKIVAARTAKGWSVPSVLTGWQNTEWYKRATIKKSNYDFYKRYVDVANSLLYSDVEEESVLVSFVNSDKKMLNFIASEDKQGFFKYERLLDKVYVGDILKVRFQGGSKDGLHKVLTASKGTNESLKKKFCKKVEGEVRISEGKEFGFVGDAFLHPTVVSKNKLASGMIIKGHAMKTFDSKKGQWSWKLVNIDKDIA
ncbi:tetratricopeptide repeat protein [Pontibacter arcticus]|uniref:Tetratricopeptide repeat protein n=1 Tax=Pontibacter arcticus TaxID=2080288 RepID=A0A364RAK6_9BACT|nr:hypothetical protein [Pontibacter arcticus]RAU81319.1 hypothetical protein DP923_15910 [Pontibacter arcticus]RAU81384.1 hypothetical protein DP923_16255 [Pontibacter arcticus]